MNIFERIFTNKKRLEAEIERLNKMIELYEMQHMEVDALIIQLMNEIERLEAKKPATKKGKK